MDIGTAIVIGAVWVFAGMAWMSKNVSGSGMWISLFVAASFTVYMIKGG